MGGDNEVIDLFEYICLRIKELGIRSIHGVPGGFIFLSLFFFFRISLGMVTN
jgi:pyruvate decarboxylase